MRSRTLPVLAIIAAAALHAMPAAAQLKVGGGGVEVLGPSNAAAAGQIDTAAHVRDMRRPGGHTLRCWQYGRLLYEGSGFRGGLERNPNAIGVPRRSEGDPVVVLDLKHATCILSEG